MVLFDKVTIPSMICSVEACVHLNKFNKSCGMACNSSTFCYDWEEDTTVSEHIKVILQFWNVSLLLKSQFSCPLG